MPAYFRDTTLVGAFLLTIGLFVAAALAAPHLSDEAYQRGVDALAAGKYEVALKEFGQVTAGAHVDDAKAKIAETNHWIEYKRRQEQEAAAKREREEAEKRAREEKAALLREQQAAEAEAARQRQEVQDFVNSCQPLNYEAVARRPADFVKVGFVFQGKVLQTAESTGVFLVQLPGGSDWVWVEYNQQLGDSRLLESDVVTVWARFKGLRTYTTVLNVEKTVPAFDAVVVQIFGRSAY